MTSEHLNLHPILPNHIITLDGNLSVYIARFDWVEKSEEKRHQEKGHIFPHENGTKKHISPMTWISMDRPDGSRTSRQSFLLAIH